jgi:hypothetical protein
LGELKKKPSAHRQAFVVVSDLNPLVRVGFGLPQCLCATFLGLNSIIDQYKSDRPNRIGSPQSQHIDNDFVRINAHKEKKLVYFTFTC